MSNVTQKLIDNFWQQTLFRILPKFLTPNYFTFLRVLSVPMVLLLLAWEQFEVALVLFLLATLFDSIDGSLARQRDCHSDIGRLLDPIADKLLILLTILFLAFYYPQPLLILIFIIFDLLIFLGGFVFLVVINKNLPVSWWGKMKVAVEALAVLVIFLYLIFNVVWLFWLSVGLLLMLIFLVTIAFVDYWFKGIDLFVADGSGK